MSEQTSSSNDSVRRRLIYWYISGALALCAGIATGFVVDWATSGIVVLAVVALWLGVPPTLTTLGVEWSAGLPLSRPPRPSASILQSDGRMMHMKPTIRQVPGSLTDRSLAGPSKGENTKQASKAEPDGTPAMNDLERSADLVRLGDLLPSAISSTRTIRQIASQSGIISGKLADEDVSAETLWPDLLEISGHAGKLEQLYFRIQKKLEYRVDVDEILEVISRLHRR
ncbi:hypothetical protein [Arthrobacter sp. BF1]|uniref:hypothetical protein n=1 Tax=Arthrobacter sp. BF1 TaxID=2821145 RepID=UPI001C4E998D|nr:hypothetical protein [Arthrobacter sp. BF1]